MSISERRPGEGGAGLSSGSFSNPPHWLVVRERAESGEPRFARGSGRRGSARLEVFTLDAAGGKTLPVFGSEEGAERFARALTAEAGAPEAGVEWRARGTGAGELISLLSGSAYSAGACADVERVALDPATEAAGEMKRETAVSEGLASTSRGCFLESLMGRGRTWFERRDPGENR